MASCASHAASVVFARKTDGTWRFCQDYRWLNAITRRLVELLLHVDQLVDETRGTRFFPNLDLTMAYSALNAVPHPEGGSLQDVVPRPQQPVRARPRVPPIPPAGFTVDAAPPSDLGAALVGRTPEDGALLVARRRLAARNRRPPQNRNFKLGQDRNCPDRGALLAPPCYAATRRRQEE